MKIRRFLRIFIFVTCGLFISISTNQKNVHGQANEWEFLNGPTAPGGVVNAIVVSPSTPETLYIIVDGGPGQRLFRSDDGSLNWQHVITFTNILSAPVTSLAIDPLDANTLYAGGNGYLMVSSNGGITWTQIFTMGAAIAVADTNHLYVADKIGEAGDSCSLSHFGVASSSDRGISWKVTPIDCAAAMPFLVTHPNDVNTVYIGAATDKSGTVWKSIDAGNTFTELPIAEQSTHPLQDLVLLPTNPEQLFASDEYGILYSGDGGTNWTRFTSWGIGSAPLNQNLPQDPFALAVDSAGTVYAIDKFTSSDGVTIYQSKDGGQTWWRAVQQLPNGAKVIKPDPHVAGKLYTGLDGFGIWQTDSSGGTWTERNTGIRSIVQVESLAVPLNDPTNLYAASYYGSRPGLFHSNNGGLSWTTVLTDIAVRTVEINPVTPTLVYAGTDTDLWTTYDSATWFPNHVEQLVNDFAISSVGPNWWYAAGVKNPFDFDNGVRLAQGQFLRFKPGDPSQGAMAYWGRKALSDTFWVYQIAVDPMNPEIVYAAIASSPSDIVYRSLDGGENWQQLLLIPNDIEQILIDERFPERIYITGASGTLFSLNHGEGWSNLENGQGRFIRKVALDNDGNVCAGTENGVWCQYDKSDIWYNTGLENVWIRSLVTSSSNANEQWMYAGTANGVWRRKFEPIQLNSTWLPVVQK